MAETKTTVPVKIKMGAEKIARTLGNDGTDIAASNLPEFEEGSLIICKDTGNLYIDMPNESKRYFVGVGHQSINRGETFNNHYNLNCALADSTYAAGYKTQAGYNYFKVTAIDVANKKITLGDATGLVAGLAYDILDFNGLTDRMKRAVRGTISKVEGTVVTVDNLPENTDSDKLANLRFTIRIDFNKVNSTNPITNQVYGNIQTNGGDQAYAIGERARAIGFDTFVGGQSNTAYGSYSAVLGKNNTAYGRSDFISGNYNIACGSNSAVFGARNKSEGHQNFTVGALNTSNGNFQTVLGLCNDNKTDTLLEVGNGSYESINDVPTVTNKSNAFEVYSDGHAEVQTQGTTDKSVVTKNYLSTTIKTEVDRAKAVESTLTTNLNSEIARAKAEEASIRAIASSAFHFKGEKESYDKLPTTGNDSGDVWQVGDKEYAWNGSRWVELGFNIEIPHPNWNENDINSINYIQNRPGGYLIPQKKSFTLTSESSMGRSELFRIDENVVYDITINGIKYTKTGINNGWNYIGNFHLISSEAEDTGEPFIFFSADTFDVQWDLDDTITTPATITFDFMGTTEQKIPSKFLDINNKQDDLGLTVASKTDKVVNITSGPTYDYLSLNGLYITKNETTGRVVLNSIGDASSSGLEISKSITNPKETFLSYNGSEIITKNSLQDSLYNINTNSITTTTDQPLFINVDAREIYLNAFDTERTTMHGLKAGTEDTDAVNLSQLKTKQDILVSGNNIKTINGQSILGSGNITIEGSGSGSTVTVDDDLSDTSTNPVQNKIVTASLNSKQDKLYLKYDSNNKLIYDGSSPVVNFNMISASDIANVDYIFSGNLADGPGFRLMDDHVVLLPPSIDVNADAGNGVLTGVLTLSTADSIYGVTDDNLPYQAANKLYVDTKTEADATVLSGSSKLITSGAVYTALTNKQNDLGLKSTKVTVSSSNVQTLSVVDSSIDRVNLVHDSSSIYMYGDSILVGVDGGSGTSATFTKTNTVKFHANRDNENANVYGVATPISAADTTLGITADDLPYQVANKDYVDTAATNKQDVFSAVTSTDTATTLTSDKQINVDCAKYAMTYNDDMEALVISFK